MMQPCKRLVNTKVGTQLTLVNPLLALARPHLISPNSYPERPVSSCQYQGTLETLT